MRLPDRDYLKAVLRQLASDALLIAVATCASPVEPRGTIPADAIQIPMPAQYLGWWFEVEQCSGLHGDLSAISWYIMPGTAFSYGGHLWGGYYERAGNVIMLGNTFSLMPSVVEHEMLHALLSPIGGHPRRYFLDKCGAVVAHTEEK